MPLQILLNFNQYFASDADYIFVPRSVYEWHNLLSSISFVIHRIKPNILTAGTIKYNFKGTIKSFVASDYAFLFISSFKVTSACWKYFLYDVLTMVKQLRKFRYFLTLTCADLRWEELPYIINKLNNLGPSDEELKKLSFQEQCTLLNDNPVLMTKPFQYKVEVFFKKIVLDGPLGKTKYYT